MDWLINDESSADKGRTRAHAPQPFFCRFILPKGTTFEQIYTILISKQIINLFLYSPDAMYTSRPIDFDESISSSVNRPIDTHKCAYTVYRKDVKANRNADLIGLGKNGDAAS